jgi:hypothetical protein
MRSEAIPTLQLWERLLGREMRLELWEDNAGTIAVIERGYSPQLRHLLKTQKVSIDLLHRIFFELGLGELMKVETEKQAADVFTKAVPVSGWQNALDMLMIR